MHDNPDAAGQTVREVAEVAGILWDRGWAESNAGNITADVTGEYIGTPAASAKERALPFPRPYGMLAGRSYLVTGTGRRMRDLARDPLAHATFLRIDDDGAGCVLFLPDGSAPTLAPTSELASHLAIHEALRARGSNERVVLHAHATELVALTHHAAFQDEATLNAMLWGMHPEAVIFLPAGVGLVPYALTGSERLATATVAAMQRHDVVLWEKHGVVAIGATPHAALDRIDIVAKSTRIWFLCAGAGFEPAGLSEAHIAELRAAFPGRG